MNNYNFSDLTPESQRMIFAQITGYAIGCKWVHIATGLSSHVAQYEVAKGALRQSSLVTDERIDDFFRSLDHGEISFFSSGIIDAIKSIVPKADEATVSLTESEVVELFSRVVDLSTPLEGERNRGDDDE